jgi:RND family efflux transporter MFP subunit
MTYNQTVESRRALLLVGLLTGGLILTSCGNKTAEAEHEHETREHAEGETAHDANEIHFTQQQAQAAGLTLETVAPGEFSSVIRVGGQLRGSTGDEQTLTASAAGVLTPAAKDLCVGRPVRRGEALYYITLGTTTEGDAVAAASAERRAAKVDYERAERLYKEQLMTARDFENARLRYEQAEAATRGVSGQGGRVAVTAPADGFVRELNAASGSFVAVGQPVATIAQNRRLQLQADVPERYADRLTCITDARFRLSSSERVYTVSELNGRLLAIAPTTDGSSPYLPVSFELDAEAGLRPGTYAEVWLLGAPEQGVISVPTESLTEEQGLYYVYLQVDEDGYRKQEVHPGRNAGSRVEILSGLTPGDQLVVKGARQVKLASATGAIPGHTHNH